MDLAEIPERKMQFLEDVLSGKSREIAAKNAGYANPGRDCYSLLVEPEVRKKFKKHLRGLAETEGISSAYDYMIKLIQDTTADKRLRLDAAKFIYAQGIPAPKALESKPDDDKAPSEMTNEELRQFIEQSEAELANRAKPASDTPQAIDSIL